MLFFGLDRPVVDSIDPESGLPVLKLWRKINELEFLVEV
jgi:hypothetical protein